MKRLLLVGAGHAHAEVLRDWIAAPLAGCELCVVSPQALSPYSGMVPGWLAGLYRFEETCIDFGALAASAGALFVADELVGLDPQRGEVRLRGGDVLGWDVLSLDVGSTLTPPATRDDASTRMLPLRPLGGLRQAWDAMLADPRLAAGDAPIRVTAVGGGAAGFESILATLARLRALRPGRRIEGGLVTASETLLPDLAPRAQRSAAAALAAAGVEVRCGRRFDAAAARASDLVLWATGAEAHPWQAASGLAVDAGGFVRVDRQLRSCSHPQVHAAGDCAAWPEPLPKSGVVAVRMGPVLSRNLRAALGDGAAVEHSPQRRYLALLSTADRRAIASWGRWSLEGRWLWRLKDRIDRGFVKRYACASRPTPTLQVTAPADDAFDAGAQRVDG
ncbi:MAG: FAD-dependent oxidoreductase [Caldimonas sp.]